MSSHASIIGSIWWGNFGHVPMSLQIPDPSTARGQTDCDSAFICTLHNCTDVNPILFNETENDCLFFLCSNKNKKKKSMKTKRKGFIFLLCVRCCWDSHSHGGLYSLWFRHSSSTALCCSFFLFFKNIFDYVFFFLSVPERCDGFTDTIIAWFACPALYTVASRPLSATDFYTVSCVRTEICVCIVFSLLPFCCCRRTERRKQKHRVKRKRTACMLMN